MTCDVYELGVRSEDVTWSDNYGRIAEVYRRVLEEYLKTCIEDHPFVGVFLYSEASAN